MSALAEIVLARALTDYARVALHGQKGKPGYELLHSPNVRVRQIANEIFKKRMSNGESATDAQTAIVKTENVASLRSAHKLAGGNKALIGSEGGKPHAAVPDSRTAGKATPRQHQPGKLTPGDLAPVKEVWHHSDVKHRDTDLRVHHDKTATLKRGDGSVSQPIPFDAKGWSAAGWSPGDGPEPPAPKEVWKHPEHDGHELHVRNDGQAQVKTPDGKLSRPVGYKSSEWAQTGWKRHDDEPKTDAGKLFKAHADKHSALSERRFDDAAEHDQIIKDLSVKLKPDASGKAPAVASKSEAPLPANGLSIADLPEPTVEDHHPHPPEDGGIPGSDASRSVDSGGDSADSLAQQMFEKGQKQEPKLTAVMHELALVHGGRLDGLKHRLKTASSLIRKILDDVAEKNVSPEAASRGMFDVNRYTIVLPDEDYAATSASAIQDLRKQGNILKVKNFWRNAKNPYQGINVQVTTKDGHQYELQFHTEMSVEVKKPLHDIYELYRVETDLGQRKALEKKMFREASKIPIPPGIM